MYWIYLVLPDVTCCWSTYSVTKLAEISSVIMDDCQCPLLRLAYHHEILDDWQVCFWIKISNHRCYMYIQTENDQRLRSCPAFKEPVSRLYNQLFYPQTLYNHYLHTYINKYTLLLFVWNYVFVYLLTGTSVYDQWAVSQPLNSKCIICVLFVIVNTQSVLSVYYLLLLFTKLPFWHKASRCIQSGLNSLLSGNCQPD